MRLWALGDPHLSFGRPRPMDVFGEIWRDHPRQIAERWDATVGDEDVVAVVGDISWARKLAEAEDDLRFIAERRGRLKLLLRGNHDSWWTSAKKVRAALPEGLAIVQNDALRLDEGLVVCGSRGWNLPSMPWSDPEKDPAIYRRELERLDLSLGAARPLLRPGDALVALLHYPPLGPDDTESEVLARLESADVDVAAYGHLHGDDHDWAPRGRYGRLELHFVAADFVRFTPQPIWSSTDGVLPADTGR